MIARLLMGAFLGVLFGFLFGVVTLLTNAMFGTTFVFRDTVAVASVVFGVLAALLM